MGFRAERTCTKFYGSLKTVTCLAISLIISKMILRSCPPEFSMKSRTVKLLKKKIDKLKQARKFPKAVLARGDIVTNIGGDGRKINNSCGMITKVEFHKYLGNTGMWMYTVQ
jgi:hypothetical protein